MSAVNSVINQHAEEAAFLWSLRDIVSHDGYYPFTDFVKLDDRIEAHLDGLRIAGDAGRAVCDEVWSLADAGEVFAAATLAFEGSDPYRIALVLEVAAGAPALARGAVSALGWIDLDRVSKHIDNLLSAGDAALRRIGLAASVAHRRDPGHALVGALADDDLFLKISALRAIGQLGRLELLPWAQNYIQAGDLGCRISASFSSLLLGNKEAIPVLMSLAAFDAPHQENVVQMAFRRMDPQSANEWQKELARTFGSTRLMIIGAGANADPALIPRLIEYMSVPEMARVAGEAFSMITGVDLAHHNLEGQRPEGFEAGPTENPEDEDVAMDPDEDLPWPDLKLIGNWWQKNRVNFKSGVRYLCGKPISEEQCQHVLRYGYQRQRAAAAIELAMMHPGTPLFNVAAPGFRQQRLLGLK